MPNTWDAGSAAVIEATGAGALATTSAGLTRSLGAAADRLDRDRAPAAVARNAAAVRVPVSADIEGSHTADPAGARDTVRAAVRQRARRHLSARRRGVDRTLERAAAFRWIGAGAAFALVRRAARELLGRGPTGAATGS
ncbi:isocitrate lyase/phosphoenolpyruvate mutase family protein [Streptomyces murinus]|uniref:isocitrate lyase/phosphoenolpyruvate mutase family protein n=1 Tax=Streptomyces murinus TaxID=33900 RepID=UPI00211593B8|nr:isocitrate lyase/phosphoenolpyruvate mutase family protein [Streptomyces murinus]